MKINIAYLIALRCIRWPNHHGKHFNYKNIWLKSIITSHLENVVSAVEGLRTETGKNESIATALALAKKMACSFCCV